MKNYVVGYFSYFKNELELFIIQSDNELEAAKKAILQMCTNEDLKYEIDFQNSEQYPQSIEDLKDYYWNADAVLNVKQIESI